jgi:hypothetical protein
MKNLLKLEEFLLFGLALFLFDQLEYAWWLYAVLFFAPDLSMFGYLWGPKVGAITYNIVHHKALAISLYILGAIWGQPSLQLAGVVLLGHSSLDRVFGYGLKYPEAFHSTHLGIIGRQKA